MGAAAGCGGEAVEAIRVSKHGGGIFTPPGGFSEWVIVIINPPAASRQARNSSACARATAVATMPAVISSDHADESMSVEALAASASSADHAAPASRRISSQDVKQHSGRAGAPFWAVIDGFVVDATEFVDTHPGGLRKLLSADDPSTGATGRPFGFSFSRGKNAHFPDTGKRFKEGVQRCLAGGSAEVAFPGYGKIVILGRLDGSAEQLKKGHSHESS